MSVSQRRSSSSSRQNAKNNAGLIIDDPVEQGSTSADSRTGEEAPFIVQSGGPIKKGSLSLEGGGRSSADDDSDEDEIDAEERYQIERHHHRIKHWRESPFAVGLVNQTWTDERTAGCRGRKGRSYGDDELNPDETGCLWCSGVVCPHLGAGRVGNMAVLKSSHEWVEEVTEDDETGERTVRRFTRPRLDIVVGPYWPMMACCTYPIIFAVSGWAFICKILPGNKHPLVILVWTVLTMGLILALAFTACRDPGILYKYKDPPPQEESLWRWTDRAYSYRPRGAFYDADTAVIVEDFDHTCPWTGTAIGKKNMLAFQFFVCLVFVCMVMDILVLTGVFDTHP